MRKLILLLNFIFWCFIGFTSDLSVSDSSFIKKELTTIEILLSRNIDSAATESYNSYILLDKKKFKKASWDALLFHGRALKVLGKMDSSFSIINKVLHESNKSNNRIYRIKSLIELGRAYVQNYDFENAIETLLKAETLLLESDSFDLRFDILNNLAISHRRMKNFDKALQIFRDLIEKFTFQLRIKQKFHVNNNIGIIYAMQFNFEDAETYFNRAYELYKNENDPASIALITQNLGGLYYRQQKFNKAEEFTTKALKSYKVLNEKHSIERSYRILSAINMDQGYHQEAEEYALKALAIANEIKSSKAQLGNYKNLYLNYKKQATKTDSKELLKKELEYFEKWAFLNDSLYGAEMAEKVLTLEKEFETEKKNNQITLLEKDNEIQESTIRNQLTQRNFILLVFGFSLLLLAVFIYWYSNSKRTNKKLQVQSKQIREQNDEISNKNHALQKAMSTRDKLFSIIAHDLRSPLSSMASFSQLIQFYLRDNKIDSIKEVAEEMHKKNSYVIELTDNLLSWASSQSENIKPQFEKVSINEIIEECLELYKTTANNKQITIRFEEKSDLTLKSDRNMAKTIIRNLVNNAIKFTQPEGLISISFHLNVDFVVISIKDDGIGMDTQTKKNLFNSDKQRIRMGTNNEKSTGLGLSVCQEFTQILNGKLHADSIEGAGSEFFLSLPSCKEESKQEIKAESPDYDFSNLLN